MAYIEVDKNGRAYFPKYIRELFHLEEGGRLSVTIENDQLCLSTVQKDRHDARRLFRQHVPEGTPVVDEFLAERRDEARLDTDK